MGLAWTPLALPGILAFVLGCAMAVVVYAAAPTRAQNRRLAVLLAVESAVVGSVGGLNPLLTDPEGALASRALHVMAFLSIPFLYLWFLGTLETPLVRALRRPVVARALLALALLAPLAYFARRELFVAGVEPGVEQTWAGVYGPAYAFVRVASTAAFVFGLLCAFALVRRHAATTATGRRARSYLAAFLLHDLGYSVVIFLALPRFEATRSGFWESVVVVGPPLVTIAFVLLMAYGILRSQLFDIELHLKWTIRQSTLAGIVIAVVFFVSEATQQLVEQSVGPFLAIAAAGVLVFALAPLQRLADRVASAALPGVQETPEYLAYKKLEVYRAALESARLDGVVTDRERAVLETLRAKLGIAAEDARRLEHELLQGA